MSTEAIADHAAKLARALRLEDVLINAGAVPLPISLTPSMIPAEASDNNDTLAKNPDPIASPDDDRQAHLQTLLDGITQHANTDGGNAQDAVANSLQAARDAIHDSLRQDGSVLPSGAAPSVDAHVAGQDAQDVSFSVAPVAASASGDSGDLSAFGSLHALAASVSSPTGDVEQGMAGIVNHASPLFADLAPASAVATPLVDQTAAGASLLDHVAGPAAGDLLDHAGSVENAASNLVHAVQPVVNDMMSVAAGSALQGILSTASAASPVDLATPVTHMAATVGDIATSVGGALEHASGLVSAVAAPLANTAALSDAGGVLAPALGTVGSAAPAAVEHTADAVTVPSLQGSGFDALAGLLQPSAAAADAAHAVANPVHASLEDMSIFATIGLDHVVHADSDIAHTVHSSLPPAGSGLI